MFHFSVLFFFFALSSKLVVFHVKCSLFLSEFNQNCGVTADVSRAHNIKVHENPFGCFVSCIRMDGRIIKFNWRSTGLRTRLKILSRVGGNK
jgi:hypothetical protein